MKHFIVIAGLLLLQGAAYGQAPATKRTPRPGVAGTLTDARNRPIPGVKVFVYGADSSIIASGYSDSTGRYETNSIAPGSYDVKVLYTSYKAVTITGTPVKSTLTNISLKADAPPNDTTMEYTVLVPDLTNKNKNGRKK